MTIPDTFADYLADLVRDRLDHLERNQRISITPQEAEEIRLELDLARRVFDSLRQV